MRKFLIRWWWTRDFERENYERMIAIWRASHKPEPHVRVENGVICSTEFFLSRDQEAKRNAWISCVDWKNKTVKISMEIERELPLPPTI